MSRQVWVIGIFAYALVWSRELPTVYAQATIETDCSTNLDQPDTIYLLNAHTAGNCIITANNITIDGQNLYNINGNVTDQAQGYNFTVQNVPSLDAVTGNGGNVTVDNVMVSTNSYFGTYGSLTIIDSEIAVNNYGIYGSGGVLISNSTINISNAGYGVYTGDGGSVTINNSNVEGFNVSVGSGSVSITDSTITLDEGVYSGNLTLIDNPPELEVTPLAVNIAHGELFNPFLGVAAEDVKDGDLTEDVIVVGSVDEAPGVYELIYSVTDGGTTIEWNSVATSSGPSTASTTRIVTREVEEQRSSSQGTRVGVRAERVEKVNSIPALSSTETADQTLERLRVFLAQPITTTDTDALKEILKLLIELVKAVSQLIVMQGKQE